MGLWNLGGIYGKLFYLHLSNHLCHFNDCNVNNDVDDDNDSVIIT